MTSAAAGPVRILRAALLAAVLLTGGAVAHAVGGGMLPSPLVLAVLGVLLVPVVLAATRRRLGPGRAAAYLALSQLGIHLALHSMHPVTGSASAAPVHCGDAAMVAAAHASGALGATGRLDPAGMVGMPGMADGGFLGLTPAMVLAHAVATVLLAWVVARGEDVLWLVVSLLLPRVPRPVRLPAHARLLVTLARRPLREGPSCSPLGSRAPPAPA